MYLLSGSIGTEIGEATAGCNIVSLPHVISFSIKGVYTLIKYQNTSVPDKY
jgi:hypothetical protein